MLTQLIPSDSWVPFPEPMPTGQRHPLSQNLPVQACTHHSVASPRDILGYNFLFIAQSFPYLLPCRDSPGVPVY